MHAFGPTYASLRLRGCVNRYAFARKGGASVKMLEQYYGHVANRAIANELAKARKKKVDSVCSGLVS